MTSPIIRDFVEEDTTDLTDQVLSLMITQAEEFVASVPPHLSEDATEHWNQPSLWDE